MGTSKPFLSISGAIFFVSILMVNGPAILSAEETRAGAYTLPEILAIAQEKNPSLAVFQANIEAARGTATSAKAYPNPDLEVELGKGKPLEQPGSGYEEERRLSVGQQVEWPVKRVYRRKAAEAGVGVAQRERDDFLLELTALGKEAFSNVLLAERIRQVSMKNVETVQALVESARLRVESGEAPELEGIKARVEFLKVMKDLRGAENRVTIAKAVLNSLLGNALGPDYEVTGELSVPRKSYELSPLIENALSRHPRILQREKALESSAYALSRERQSRVPDLVVRGSIGEEIDKRSYSVGLSIPLPLLYQRQGEIAEARADQSRARAELERTRTDLTRRITEEYQNYRIALDQLAVFEEGLLQEAEEARRIAQFSYQQGESDLINLLDAQRVERTTLIEYYEAQFELQAALARLEQVSGGLP